MATHGSVLVEVGGQELRVEYDYSKGTPDVMYLGNGDPGYPGDPEEFGVTAVWINFPQLDFLTKEWKPVWYEISDLLHEMQQGGGGWDDPVTSAAYDAMISEEADRRIEQLEQRAEEKHFEGREFP